MSLEQNEHIARVFEDDSVIDEALVKGVRDALRWHKLAGNPVAEWRDGRVVWVPPEEIDVSGPPRSGPPTLMG